MYGSHGLETGFNYELMHRFAQDNHCNIRIVTAGKDESYIDSLRNGVVDIVITHDKSIRHDERITTLKEINDCSVWAFNSAETDDIRQLDNWIGYIKASDEFSILKKRYTGTFNPQKRAEKGITKTARLGLENGSRGRISGIKVLHQFKIIQRRTGTYAGNAADRKILRSGQSAGP